MLPRDNHYGGWPRSGEIDMMESKGIKQQHVFFQRCLITSLTKKQKEFDIFFSILYALRNFMEGKEKNVKH